MNKNRNNAKQVFLKRKLTESKKEVNFINFLNYLNESINTDEYTSFSQMKKGEEIRVTAEMFDVQGIITAIKDDGIRLKLTIIDELPSDDEYDDEYNGSSRLKIGSVVRFGSFQGNSENYEFQTHQFFKT